MNSQDWTQPANPAIASAGSGLTARVLLSLSTGWLAEVLVLANPILWSGGEAVAGLSECTAGPMMGSMKYWPVSVTNTSRADCLYVVLVMICRKLGPSHRPKHPQIVFFMPKMVSVYISTANFAIF